MSIFQTNTTNPLRIQRISKQDIEIAVYRDEEGFAEKFAVNSLALDRYKLEDTCEVKLCAYTRSREQWVSLGKIGQLDLDTRHSFSLERSRPPLFRLIVCESGKPDIIASREGIRANVETDEIGKQYLLPVEPADDLGEKLWEMRIDNDDNPVLYVNNDATIGMLNRIKSDPITFGLVLPQAVEQIAFRLFKDMGTDDEGEDEEDWKARWRTYLQQRDLEFPNDPDDREGGEQWAREVAGIFANEHKMASKLRAHIEESEDGG